MNISIVSEIANNGQEELVNTRGCETIDIELKDINCFSFEPKSRLVGVGKNLYRMTLKSYHELKRELTNRGLIQRFYLGK